MPQIDMAMVASRTQPFFRRASSITDEVSSVKNSFSSWDNCMQASYCKYPVIIAIIIGGLIIFSVVWCVVRCACCGLSCCCTCFSCLKCCGECCGMCDGRKDKSHKHIDEPFQPKPFQPGPYTGYQAPAPMGYESPKYAQFETGKNGLAVEPPKPIVHEDALPPMPSWEGASQKRIPTADQKEEGMEMGNLTPDGQNIPLMSGGVGGARSPGHTSPVNEAGGNYFGGRGQNGYMQGQPGGNLPYGPGGISRTGSPAMMNGRGGMGGLPGGQFNQSPTGYNPQRPGFPPTAGYRGPPQRQYSNDSGAPYARNGAPPQRQYSNDSGSLYPPNGPQRQLTGNNGFPQPGPSRQYSNDSGAPYPQGGPQRQLTGNRGGFSQPAPQRQYSNDSYRPSQDIYRPPASPSSPLNNSGGFDFNLGGTTNQSRYDSSSEHRFGQSEPSVYAPSTTAPPSYATRGPSSRQQRQFSPPPQELHEHERAYSSRQEVHEMPAPEQAVSRPDGGAAYPGWKPYSPAPEGARSTPPPPSALMPGRPNY